MVRRADLEQPAVVELLQRAASVHGDTGLATELPRRISLLTWGVAPPGEAWQAWSAEPFIETDRELSAALNDGPHALGVSRLTLSLFFMMCTHFELFLMTCTDA